MNIQRNQLPFVWQCKCGKLEHTAQQIEPDQWLWRKVDGFFCWQCEDCARPAAPAGIEVKPGINTKMLIEVGIYVDNSDPENCRVSITDCQFLQSERISE